MELERTRFKRMILGSTLFCRASGFKLQRSTTKYNASSQKKRTLSKKMQKVENGLSWQMGMGICNYNTSLRENDDSDLGSRAANRNQRPEEPR